MPVTSTRGRLTKAQRAARTDELVACLSDCPDRERCRQLRSDLVVVNCGVAEAVARRYRRRGIDDDDLTQTAYEGLVKAVDRFDPARRRNLLSYAVPVMRGEIQRYFRDHGWMVRPTRSVQELQWRINQTVDALEAELGREPTDAEVIERLEVSPSAYREALAAFGCFQPTSLDRPVRSDSTRTLGQVVTDTEDPSQSTDAALVVGDALRTLPQQDRRLLQLRYVDELTQSEIGDRMGMTQMKVSRHLSRLLDRLEHVIGEYDGLGQAV
ncbi:MAG: sigma-70 family RNA polymerase sigma factor [Nocardioidaceae bacterium]|nr:sigma-70 family RNA polymerase sigma factor [Nocardioidaceae bacterium]MCL2615169.1 sigma-70 family RNA polymerase sigma factor [Nocardioidaceae bacterium]